MFSISSAQFLLNFAIFSPLFFLTSTNICRHSFSTSHFSPVILPNFIICSQLYFLNQTIFSPLFFFNFRIFIGYYSLSSPCFTKTGVSLYNVSFIRTSSNNRILLHTPVMRGTTKLTLNS